MGTAALKVLDRAKNLAVPRHVVNDNIKKATERDQADFTEVSSSQCRFDSKSCDDLKHSLCRWCMRAMALQRLDLSSSASPTI